MRRLLMALVLFGAAILLLRRFGGLFGPALPAGQRRKGTGGRGRGQEGATELVRDKVCNTFLPKSKALELTTRGETLYFCSGECRSTLLEGPTRQSDIARRA